MIYKAHDELPPLTEAQCSILGLHFYEHWHRKTDKGRKSKRLGMGGERVKDGEKDRGKRERGLQWRVFGMSGKRRICEEEWSGERRPV